MNYIRTIAVLILSLTLTGCDLFLGEKVEVPPAHVGKILGKNGYSPEIIPPSKFRLDKCWAYCDKLVLLETSDTAFIEQMTVFMPDDKLNLKVEVRGTMTVPATSSAVNPLYDRLVATSVDGTTMKIGVDQIYGTYGKQALRGVVRSRVVESTISQILSERDAVGRNIHAAVSEKLAESHTPIRVSRLELASVQPPAVIVEAQQNAKEREIAIQQAEANAQVQLVEAERALEVAKMNRLVRRENAEALAEENRIAAESVTAELLAYRKLETAAEVFALIAQSDNALIIPADSSPFSSIVDDAVLAKMLGSELGKAQVAAR